METTNRRHDCVIKNFTLEPQSFRLSPTAPPHLLYSCGPTNALRVNFVQMLWTKFKFAQDIIFEVRRVCRNIVENESLERKTTGPKVRLTFIYMKNCLVTQVLTLSLHMACDVFRILCDLNARRFLKQ